MFHTHIPHPYDSKNGQFGFMVRVIEMRVGSGADRENFYEVGYLPLLSGIMNDLGMRRKIDELVHVDRQCRTTAGEAVQLLVLDMRVLSRFSLFFFTR